MQLWISIKTWGLRLIQKASKACFGTQSSSWWVCKRMGLYCLAVCFLIIWVGSIRKFTNCAFCNSKSIFVYLRFKHEYMINRKKPFFPLLQKRFDEETLKWIYCINLIFYCFAINFSTLQNFLLPSPHKLQTKAR